MAIELTEIINCRIMGPFSSQRKADVPLEQNDKREQVVICWDAHGADGKYVVLPKENGRNRARCRNFMCRNNQLLGDDRV
jgi:hypothetical protein